MKWFTLVLFMIVLSGCASMTKIAGKVAGDEKTAEKATEDLTPRQEYYLGRSIAASVLTEQELSQSKEAQAYINTLGRYLVLHSQRPNTFKGYRFAIVKDETGSAMSAPGGFVFISDGVIKAAQSEDELAAVIAHEIAHIDLRHAEKIIQEKNMNSFWKKKFSQGLSLGLELSGKGDTGVGKISEAAFNFGANYVEQSLTMKFDKGQEVAADAHAIGILKNAGYDPWALRDFISRMKAAKNSRRHPSSQERLSKMDEMLGDFQRRAVHQVRWRRLEDVKERL